MTDIGKTVLVMADYYLPGHKGGGPIKSLYGLMSSTPHDFCLITRCHDLGDKQAYAAPIDIWLDREECEIFYSSKPLSSIRQFIARIRTGTVSHIYLNSFFSPLYSLLPLLLCGLLFRNNNVTCVIAPRGELGAGALAFKATKKKLFIVFSKLVGLHNNTVWHVTSQQELEEVTEIFGINIKYFLASNIVNYEPIEESWLPVDRHLKVVFLSRLVRKKNLMTVINSLILCKQKVTFHIYGPKEDHLYWLECEARLADLPNHVEWEYCGDIAGENVRLVFEQYDMFIFPSYNENFGHVIAEALSVGCVVITSDKTPWHQLATLDLGWIVGSENVDEIATAVDAYMNLTCDQRLQLRQRIKKYFSSWMKDQKSIEIVTEAFSTE